MTDDRQRALEVLAQTYEAKGGESYAAKARDVRANNLGDDDRRATDAMLAFATPSTPEAGVGIPAGMKPWSGGDSAPADWDGGPVLLRDGFTLDPKVAGGAPLVWQHARGMWASGDIIAYTPKPTPADIPTNDDALRAVILNDATIFGEVERRMRECWIGTGKLSDEGSASNDFRVWMNEAHNRQRDLKAALGQNPNVPLAALSTPSTAARPDVDHISDAREMVERLRDDLKHAESAIVASCEGCAAPLFDGDDFVTGPEDGVSGCWAAMTDLPSKRDRPCYAYRVGKPSALASLPDTTSPQDVDQGEPG